MRCAAVQEEVATGIAHVYTAGVAVGTVGALWLKTQEC